MRLTGVIWGNRVLGLGLTMNLRLIQKCLGVYGNVKGFGLRANLYEVES